MNLICEIACLRRFSVCHQIFYHPVLPQLFFHQVSKEDIQSQFRRMMKKEHLLLGEIQILLHVIANLSSPIFVVSILDLVALFLRVFVLIRSKHFLQQKATLEADLTTSSLMIKFCCGSHQKNQTQIIISVTW